MKIVFWRGEGKVKNVTVVEAILFVECTIAVW
jgi:hypothetical protein